MATVVQDWARIDYTPSSAVSEGDVIVEEDLIGVATSDIASGELGSLCISGVIDFPKTGGGGIAFSVGEIGYWDVSATSADTSSDTGTNKQIGKAVGAAADAATTVRMLLSQ